MIEDFLTHLNLTASSGSRTLLLLRAPLPNRPLVVRARAERDLPTPFPAHIRVARVVRQTPQRMDGAELRAAIPGGEAAGGGAAEFGVEGVQDPGVE